MQQEKVISKVAEMQPQKVQDQAKVKEEAKIIQLIVFNLGDEELGATIDQIREIIRVGSITPIPNSPDFIKGVANVRGEITVAVDLKERFFLHTKKETESKHMIITEQEGNLFGLMVDEVTEVLRIPETDIKPAPKLVTRKERVYINGVLTLENRLIVLLDLRKVLSEQELARLAEMAKIQHTVVEKEGEKAKLETLKTAEKKEQRMEQKTTEPAEKVKQKEGKNPSNPAEKKKNKKRKNRL